MGQSLSKIYVHLIFATKGRKPFIKKELREPLNHYVMGILKQNNCPSLQTNCVEDHMHILFRLSKNVALSKVVEQVKKRSSKWMKEVEGGNQDFRWQIGYAAFSVNSSGVDVVSRYIMNQERHHMKKTLKVEVEEYVKAYDVMEYDDQYFWS